MIDYRTPFSLQLRTNSGHRRSVLMRNSGELQIFSEILTGQASNLGRNLEFKAIKCLNQ
jgi:hypothetical protein